MAVDCSLRNFFMPRSLELHFVTSVAGPVCSVEEQGSLWLY